MKKLFCALLLPAVFLGPLFAQNGPPTTPEIDIQALAYVAATSSMDLPMREIAP